ncbi:hypothetical protein AOLI_G00185600 [Acnodon oligacanthus]
MDGWMNEETEDELKVEEGEGEEMVSVLFKALRERPQAERRINGKIDLEEEGKTPPCRPSSKEI